MREATSDKLLVPQLTTVVVLPTAQQWALLDVVMQNGWHECT